MSSRTPILPAHIEDTVAAIAEVHAEHYRQAGPVQRLVSAATTALARPSVLGALTAIVTGWIALNIGLQAAGHLPLDPPPFSYLSTAASVAALLLAAMILITQRHDDELATHRDQLTLELAILGERKSAKIIQMLEEFRKDDPEQGGRDVEAEALAVPADPQAVLDAIKATH